MRSRCDLRWDFLLFTHFGKSAADPRWEVKGEGRAREAEGWGLGSPPRTLRILSLGVLEKPLARAYPLCSTWTITRRPAR